MRIIFLVIFYFYLLVPGAAASAENLRLPDTIGTGTVLTRTENPESWTPDNMYEHVNGEAELLKRFGAVKLTYAAYENEDGSYFSVDILDMGSSVNAFGLFSVYSGCGSNEYSFSGATVLLGDFTAYAIFGRYFLRLDFDVDGGSGPGTSLVNEFLSALSAILPAPEPLPAVVNFLKTLARNPCDVGYHPEHVDYDLETGPGYTWVGPDGATYFIVFLPSPETTDGYAALLRKKGVALVMVRDNAVTWPNVTAANTERYLDRVLQKLRTLANTPDLD